MLVASAAALAGEPVRSSDTVVLNGASLKAPTLRLSAPKIRGEAARRDDSGHVGIEISLDDPGDDGDGKENYIYLHSDFGVVDDGADGAPGARSAAPSMTAAGLDGARILSRAAGRLNSGLTAPSLLTVNQPGRFTPRYAGFRLGFMRAAEGPDGLRRGFDVALSSTYLTTDSTGLAGAGLGGAAGLAGGDDRAYNIALNVGWRGFSVGASLLRGERLEDGAYAGVDLGLAYSGRSWATSITVGEHTVSRGAAALGSLDERAYTIELGAAYSIRPGIMLSGRFRYYDLPALTEGNERTDSGVFFLGTNLNF